MEDSLVTLNGRLHERLGELAVQWMVALTALELVDARAHFDELSAAIREHGRAEHAVALPLYRRLLNGNANLALHVEGDHRILESSLVQVEHAVRALESRDGDDRRRQLVETLPGVVRLRSVWNHHTLREQNVLYPTLDEGLSPRERDEVAQQVFGA